MRNLFLVLIAVLIGCSENQPLSMLLDETSKPTSEIASEIGTCFKDLTAEDSEYAITFDKGCIDDLMLSDQWTAEQVAEMVSEDDFRLEGRTIQLTGVVGFRSVESGGLVINTGHDQVNIWIYPPYLTEKKQWDASKTEQYRLVESYTFDVRVKGIDRDTAFGNMPEYDVYCDLIVSE